MHTSHSGHQKLARKLYCLRQHPAHSPLRNVDSCRTSVYPELLSMPQRRRGLRLQKGCATSANTATLSPCDARNHVPFLITSGGFAGGETFCVCFVCFCCTPIISRILPLHYTTTHTSFKCPTLENSQFQIHPIAPPGCAASSAKLLCACGKHRDRELLP